VRSAVVAAAIGALLLAGCGDDESDAERRQTETRLEDAVQQARLKALLRVKQAERRRREEHPGQTLAPPKFTGVRAERYEFDREVCTAVEPSELARELGLDEDSDPEAIAEAYAKSFPGELHQPSLEGCLAGLE
jgi:hypothetical protein